MSRVPRESVRHSDELFSSTGAAAQPVEDAAENREQHCLGRSIHKGGLYSNVLEVTTLLVHHEPKVVSFCLPSRSRRTSEAFGEKVAGK